MVQLEPFGEEDFDRFIRWAETPRLLVQWAGTTSGLRHPVTVDQLQKYLQTGRAEPATRLIYRARLGDDIVGHIELDRINRSRGIAGDMVRQTTAIGFTRFDLRRIDLGVYAFNAGAIRCYEEGGFVREGTFRKAVLVGDEAWDVMMMSILREEWRPA